MKSRKKNIAYLEPVEDIPVAHRLSEVFWILGPAFARWADSHMGHHGFTPQRMRLMALLFKNGPMKMSALRKELGVTATNVTALVDALENDGLVVRKPHATDRRATLINITPKAEKKLKDSCGPFKDQVSQLFTCFSKTEQVQFLQLLLQMRRSLVERNILQESDLAPKDVCKHR